MSKPFLLPALDAEIGFDPASGEDRTVVLQRWQKELVRKLTAAYGVSPRLVGATFGPGSKTYRSGYHRMAHPVNPFPYGTIIKPTATNTAFPPEHRQMVIGPAPAPHTEEAICAIQPDAEDPTFYLHTIEGIEQRWEVAE